ncbi:cation:proton antiporter [Desulfosediminicola sp.]|uniref:cation:proton antiporter n=1 Tax=Desulfosediminicola sp. TaxID=2886825 RepID=UPI003AF2B79B
MYANLAVICIFVFIYSVTSGVIGRSLISGAIMFTAFGLVSGPLGFDLLSLDIEAEGLKSLAELTLALVLFSDAANADLKVLRQNFRIPQRLLCIGLPLTIISGILVGGIIFRDLGWLEIAILATILAPTDAALGAAVVTDKKVPVNLRESLNIESGLNDGICVPVLLTFLTVATDSVEQGKPLLIAFQYTFEEIGIGLIVGGLLAVGGSLLINYCKNRNWINEDWQELPVIALSLSCFSLAQLAGGSGFIAAFCGGLIFGGMVREHKHQYLLAAEGAGDGLSLITWTVFGCSVVSSTIGSFGWQSIVFALLSLTVIRMLPVYVALSATALNTSDKLFIGWFGPRGLATIVFAVMIFNSQLPHKAEIVITAVCCVILSIIGHGISAHPLIAVLSRRHGK